MDSPDRPRSERSFVHIGSAIALCPAGAAGVLVGQTLSGRPSEAEVTVFDLKGPENLHLSLGYVTWATGDREVRALHRHSSPERFDGIKNRARLELVPLSSREMYCALKQYRFGGDPESSKPTAHPTDIAGLSSAAEADVASTLLSLGASKVAWREDIVGPPERGASFICASFLVDNVLVPIAAFVITRVYPVLRRLPA